MSNPTIRDIARRLGTSTATVSMALRNHPGVSATTARRVQETAIKMGWTPNPLISAYQTYVRSRKSADHHTTIAWLEDLPGPRAGGLGPPRKRMREAAAAHAARTGFKLEEISQSGLTIDDLQHNVAVFRRIMETRGILGFIIPVGLIVHHAGVDWTPFAVAVIGRMQRFLERSAYTLDSHVRYHSVASDAFHAAHVAWKRLRALGCQRIGLVLSRFHHFSSDCLYEAAVLSAQSHLPLSQRVSPLIPEKETVVFENLPAWLDKHRPDGILCEDNRMVEWLRSAGYRVPEDIAVAHLNIGPEEPGWSGMDELIDAQAASAVDLIVGQILRNERTAPAVPKQVLIQGTWCDGWTAKPRA